MKKSKWFTVCAAILVTGSVSAAELSRSSIGAAISSTSSYKLQKYFSSLLTNLLNFLRTISTAIGKLGAIGATLFLWWQVLGGLSWARWRQVILVLGGWEGNWWFIVNVATSISCVQLVDIGTNWGNQSQTQ